MICDPILAGEVECIIHLEHMVYRPREGTNWERVYEGINSRRWDGFKELYEMLAAVDVWWRCSYKSLYAVGDIAWELVGGTSHVGIVGW